MKELVSRQSLGLEQVYYGKFHPASVVYALPVPVGCAIMTLSKVIRADTVRLQALSSRWMMRSTF